MTDDAGRRFEQAIAGIPRDLEVIFTVIALCEPVNVSHLSDLLFPAGVRTSAKRQYGTQTVREPLNELSKRGLLRTDGAFFACEPHLRHRLLRHMARQGRLEPLAKALAETQFGRGSARYVYDDGWDRSEFEARVALCSGAAGVDSMLEELAKIRSAAEVVEALVVPALVEFDVVWFDQLSPAFRARWLGSALTHVEAYGHDAGKLVDYLVARADGLIGEPEVVLTLAGILLERGDWDALKKLGTLPLPDVSASIGAALAVVEGRYADAANLVPRPRKGTAQGTGSIAILHTLAILARATSDDLQLARRLVSAGSRNHVPLRLSFRVMKHILDGTVDPERLASNPFTDVHEPDCIAPLLRMLWVSWFDSLSALAAYAVSLSQALPARYSARGLTWLAAEIVHTAYALSRKLRDQSARTVREFDLPAADAPPPKSAPLAPLLRLRGEKAPWELILEGLERLTATDGGAEAKREADERLIWRVNPELSDVDPYLQKRVGGGFSKGRKLALKHLLPGAAQAAALPPEDARVAAHAREMRETYGGYPQVRHLLLPEAFVALVGHPRVFLAEDDAPVEVVRGQVQLLVRREAAELVISIEPQDFDGNVKVEQQGRRLFVYALDPAAKPLLKWLKQRLVLPAQAQSRALAVLGRLSHLLPVQSFETTDARKVAADARPWLRITPRGAALSVTLSTRPLGATGPHVKPGHGAPTMLGHLEGEAVQADRSFDEERQRAQALLAECAVLGANEVGEYSYELADATECLELIAALRDLEPEVHVEWPHGKPLRLRGRASRRALHGNVSRASDFFLATGSLKIDDELSLELEELLGLVSESPGRFVRLASGDYLELERELREALEGLAAVRSDGRGRSAKAGSRGVALGKSALSALQGLFAEGSGFELDQSSEQFRQQLLTAFERQARIPRTLQAELRGYQVEGFRWLARLAELELGCCLADDMGLGKTIQILALLLQRMKSGPALIVAPTSVCDNWRDEIARFAPSLEVRWYFGASRERELRQLHAGQVLITSYNLLQQDAEKLQALAFSTAVLDEAQFIKNADSLRAKSACGLDAKVRIAATGTPVENHVGDLFGIFQFLMPELLGSRSSFHKRFPLNAEGEAGVAARRNLRRLIQPFVLRRTKAQVLSELPELTEIRRSVTLTPEEAALYESLRRAAIEKLSAFAEPEPARADPRAHFQVLAEITRLRRLCCHPVLVMPGTKLESSKLSSFLELVDELMEGQHRALVFSQFVDMLSLAREALDQKGINYQYLDGKTPQAQRKAAVDAFQAGDGDLFLISLRAGGFGLNLTGADYVIHLDPWWNPAVEAQASDRAHRIGQTRPVTVYRLITAHTVEDRIVDLHRTKRELADSLLEDSDRTAKLTVDELRALLDG